MRTSSPLQVIEIGGDKYPDLATAQEKALPIIAADLAEVIRRLLAQGVLINVDGKIIINPKRKP